MNFKRVLRLIVSAAMLSLTWDDKPAPSQLVAGVSNELLASDIIGMAKSSYFKYISLHDTCADGGHSADFLENVENKEVRRQRSDLLLC